MARAAVGRREAGLLLKLLVHPEYEVRLAALTALQVATGPPPVYPQDLYTLLLGEQDPACREQLLLTCCAAAAPAVEATSAAAAAFSEDSLAFLLSMVHTAVNDSVAAAALR